MRILQGWLAESNLQKFLAIILIASVSGSGKAVKRGSSFHGQKDTDPPYLTQKSGSNWLGLFKIIQMLRWMKFAGILKRIVPWLQSIKLLANSATSLKGTLKASEQAGKCEKLLRCPAL